MANEVLGWASKLSIGGTAVEFVSCDIRETIEIIKSEETRGTRTRTYERTAQGLKRYAGSIVMHPTPAELALVLPFVFNSGNALPLTDAMQDVVVILDCPTKSATHTGRLSKLTITLTPGQKIELRLDYIGKSATFGAGGAISTKPDITVRPYVCSDAAGITINSVSYQFEHLEFSVDNAISPTFMNGQTATDLEPTDRICMLSIQTRYSSAEQALLALAQAGPVVGSPLTGSFSMTNGSNSAAFAWAAMVAQSQTVTVGGPTQKLRLPLTYELMGVNYGATKENVTTLV